MIIGISPKYFSSYFKKTFGVNYVEYLLGTLGNIISQIANAAAIRVAGLDLNHERVVMLREQGLTHVYVRTCLR